MEKEFVPYDRAFKLKALGFNQPCFGGFNDAGSLYIQKLYFQSEKEEWCLAPTFSQAFKWFREKYGLYDTISKNGYMIEGETNSGFLRITRLTLNSHEEAELACLDKLIEIVEQKEK